MAGSSLTRREFLRHTGRVGATTAVATTTAAFGLAAFARAGAARRAVHAPPPTIGPLAARHPLQRLLVPLPPWIHTGPTGTPRVALTIDDMWGAFGADNADAAMDVAKAKGVKLTFFPTGGALEEHLGLGRQATWQRAVAEGHDVGNHTYTHSNLTKLTDDQIRFELDHTRDLLAQCLGPSVPYTPRLMRPPGGAGGFVTGGDPRVMNVVTSLGYSMTMWTVDGNGVRGNAAFVDKVMRHASDGTIVLIHFTQLTPAGLSTLIDRLRAQELEPTSITGLFG